MNKYPQAIVLSLVCAFSLLAPGPAFAQRVASEIELDCLIWEYQAGPDYESGKVWVHAETGEVMASGRTIAPNVKYHCLVDRQCRCLVRRNHYTLVVDQLSQRLSSTIREEHQLLRAQLDNLVQTLTIFAQQTAEQVAAVEVTAALEQLRQEALSEEQRQRMVNQLMKDTEEGQFREALVDLIQEVIDSQKSQ